MEIVFAILYFAILASLVYGVFWGIETLVKLRRGQARLQADVDRIAHKLGLPPRPDQMVVGCDKCGAEYAAFLTGCEKCGSRKPTDAIPHARRVTDSTQS